VLLGSKIYDEKADMWSIGCIIAEMLLKCPIFAGNSTLQQLEAIMTFTGKPNLDELNEI
jgi:serine/threonine protein kinase